MGNQKQKWTAEEEDALLSGVAKHGPGKWKNILKDPDFAPYLTQRSNIDLKDKWRNLSVSTGGQGAKEKSRTPRVKAAAVALAGAGASPTMAMGTPATASPIPRAPNCTPITRDGSSQMVTDDPLNAAVDAKNVPRYNAMVFEALSTIKDANGSDIGAIVSFIEQRHEVPQNFRRLLGSRLRRLVSQGKLEKVENRYKICDDATMATKTPTPKQKDIKSRPSNTPGSTPSGETLEEAAITAAYKVAEAENKSFLAAEAVKEAERIAKMAEDTESMLQIAMDIYEQCSRADIALLA